MKRCPVCHRVESEDSLSFCRTDGAALVTDSSSVDADAGTVRFNTPINLENATSLLQTPVTSAGEPTTLVDTQRRLDRPHSDRKGTRLKLVLMILIGCLLAFVAAAVAGYVLIIRKTNPAIDSIAVLPFENQNHDADSDYLADGLTETIINNLSNISTLRVSSRNSVYRYKGKATDPSAIAKELGVRAVLSGRVLQRGENLIVSAELVDMRDNKQVWGENYSRKLSDLQAVQEEIARQITQTLQRRLSGEEQKQLSKHYTENSEAYQLYLKGHYQLNKRTEESLTKGIDYFRQATEQDPSYALAYAGLAEAYNQLGLWARLPPNESFPRAKAAAEKALQLDSSLAEAHAALSFLKFQYYWDFAGSEREYQQAISLNPRYVPAREWHAYHSYLADPNRFTAAMEELKTAQEIDPLSLSVNFNTCSLLYFNRQYDETISRLAAIHDLDPNYTLGYGLLGVIYMQKRMPDKALEAWLQASALEGEGQTAVSEQALRDAYKKSGIEGYLRKHIELLQEDSKRHYVSPYFIAIDYAFLGEKDRAFEWLEKAYQERSSWLVEVRVDPVWDVLRGDARYGQLLRRMGYSVQ